MCVLTFFSSFVFSPPGTPADTYNLDFAPGHNLTPTQKAAVIGEMIHLDFLFFEAGKMIVLLNHVLLFVVCLLCVAAVPDVFSFFFFFGVFLLFFSVPFVDISQDAPICQSDDDGTSILLCTCYLMGCLCPCKLFCPKKKE